MPPQQRPSGHQFGCSRCDNSENQSVPGNGEHFVFPWGWVLFLARYAQLQLELFRSVPPWPPSIPERLLLTSLASPRVIHTPCVDKLSVLFISLHFVYVALSYFLTLLGTTLLIHLRSHRTLTVAHVFPLQAYFRGGFKNQWTSFVHPPAATSVALFLVWHELPFLFSFSTNCLLPCLTVVLILMYYMYCILSFSALWHESIVFLHLGSIFPNILSRLLYYWTPKPFDP